MKINGQLAITATPHRDVRTLNRFAARPGTRLAISEPGQWVPAIVVASREDAWDVVTSAGCLRNFDGQTLATITDNAVVPATVGQAIRVLGEARRWLIDDNTRLAGGVDSERRERREQLEAIRAYAVKQHKDGAICREGLDAFLAAFDMAVYEPRVRVNFTISGSVMVEPTGSCSPDDVADDVRHNIELDLSSVAGVIDTSVDLFVDAVDAVTVS